MKTTRTRYVEINFTECEPITSDTQVSLVGKVAMRNHQLKKVRQGAEADKSKPPVHP
jgi:hypothetical protein